MTLKPVRIALVGPHRPRCGISDYSAVLWPAIEAEAAAGRAEGSKGFEVKRFEFSDSRSLRDLVEELAVFGPSLLHIQHEYGIFGGKNPPLYEFPRWVWHLRQALPETKIVATAHTVLDPGYRFPLAGRGWQKPLRVLANRFLLSRLQRVWGPETWGGLDAVIAHSKHQLESLKASGVKRAESIPHFVPVSSAGFVDADRTESSGEKRRFRCLVFGFFTPEKGQDIAIEAWGLLKSRLPQNHMPELLLAGGVRRPADRRYRERCLNRIDQLKLGGLVRVGEFIPANRIDGLYRETDLVLTPFRETSGSGSIAQALSRGTAILASDLELNRELDERTKGCLAFFKAESAADLAEQVTELMRAPQRMSALRECSQAYAKAHDPSSTARSHLSFYERCLSP